MAQHDGNLANGSGAAVRADANVALAALFTLSSGDTAPSTPYANMWWGDTTNGIFWQRNGDNSAWIPKWSTSADVAVTKTATYTVALGDCGKVIKADASGGAFTITLPPVATASEGFMVQIQKSDSSANAVTLDGDGTETINGATTVALGLQYQSAVLVCDGSGWVMKTERSLGQGIRAIPIGAGALTANITAGPAAGVLETSTNKVMVPYLAFDASVTESAQVGFVLPPSYDGGTIKATINWMHPSTTTNFGVVWQVSAVAVSDGQDHDTAFGSSVSISDTGGSANRNYQTARSAEITIGNTPVPGDKVTLKINRNPGDASDTMAVDAYLTDVTVFVGLNAATDA